MSLGHASLVAALRSSDVHVDEHTYRVDDPRFDWRVVVSDVLASAGNNQDIAFGAYIWNEQYLQKILPALRRHGFRGRLILGGPQVSYATGNLEQWYPQVDVFIRGYGEQALIAVATRPHIDDVPGVHLAGARFKGDQARIELDQLPSPFLSGSLLVAKGQPFIRWETQRGCPFRCNFCQHREPGQRLRRRELGRDRVFDEIALFVERNVEDIAVLDPIFNANARSTAILQRFAERSFPGRLSMQCRFEMLTDEFLDACSALDVRLEFGLQTIHPKEQQAIERPNNLPRVAAAMANLRSRDIAFEVSLIYGLPEQTLDSFEQTVDWCLERGVPVIKAFPLMLLRGTKLAQERQRWGLQEDGAAIPAVISSHSFTTAERQRMHDIAQALARTEGRHPTSVSQLDTSG